MAGSRACELRAGMRGPATPQLSHPHSGQHLRLPQMPPNPPASQLARQRTSWQRIPGILHICLWTSLWRCGSWRGRRGTAGQRGCHWAGEGGGGRRCQEHPVAAPGRREQGLAGIKLHAACGRLQQQQHSMSISRHRLSGCQARPPLAAPPSKSPPPPLRRAAPAAAG